MYVEKRRWIVLTAFSFLVLLVLVASHSFAQGRYPERPITWIVAFSPGGNSDIEVRRLQPYLEKALGVKILVEYRPGAGGAVGWAELARAKPDGYTVGGLVLPHMVVQELTQGESRAFRLNEIVPVVWNVSAPQALMVREGSRFRSLDDFIAFARENPGRLTVGGVDTLSASELAFGQLRRMAGINIVYVPITGGAGPLIAALLGGHIDAAITSAPHGIRRERVRVLAVAGDRRLEVAPEVPTFIEHGLTVTVRSVWGVGVPRGTPDEAVQKLYQAISEAMKTPAVRDAVVNEGLEILDLGPGPAQEYVQKLLREYSEILKTLRR